jgi:hypothetical protein
MVRSLRGMVSRKAGRARKRLIHDSISLYVWLTWSIVLDALVRMRQSVYFLTPSVVMSIIFLQHAGRRYTEGAPTT